jgi:hypothetical protein
MTAQRRCQRKCRSIARSAAAPIEFDY